VVRGEAVAGGARCGGDGVELVDEREFAARLEEVGEYVRLRPYDLTEAVVESILEAAAGAEADDLLLAVRWSDGECLQRWPGHLKAQRLIRFKFGPIM
jgi:hypothetical protein